MLTARGVRTGPATTDVDEAPGPRQARRRRSLPNGRAVVGGLLVALASLGVYAAAASAGRSDLASYVVAADDLAVGDRITARDVTTAAMELPDALARSRVYGSPTQVIGSIVVAPVARGELLQASAIARRAQPGRHVSFSLEPSRAVAGAIGPGDRIDVLATYGAGAEAWTEVVVRDTAVVAVESGRGALGEQGRLVVTVLVPNELSAVALSHAASAGALTVVRATGATVEPTAPSSYRPVPAPPGDSSEVPAP